VDENPIDIVLEGMYSTLGGSEVFPCVCMAPFDPIQIDPLKAVVDEPAAKDKEDESQDEGDPDEKPKVEVVEEILFPSVTLLQLSDQIGECSEEKNNLSASETTKESREPIVGMRVELTQDGSLTWVVGVITQINTDETYEVDIGGNGEVVAVVNKSCIRMIEKSAVEDADEGEEATAGAEKKSNADDAPPPQVASTSTAETSAEKV
jgi:hypothetical protein